MNKKYIIGLALTLCLLLVGSVALAANYCISCGEYLGGQYNFCPNCGTAQPSGGGSNPASYVTTTSDQIWLLSEFEVQGTRSYANSAEQNYQKQYDYYKNGNSKVKYKHNATTTACYWWLRSVYATYTYRFCIVYTDGRALNDRAYSSIGFAPGFKVA